MTYKKVILQRKWAAKMEILVNFKKSNILGLGVNTIAGREKQVPQNYLVA